MSATSIRLTDHEQEFLSAQVESGRHGSLDDALHEAIRRYEGDVLREQAHEEYLDRLTVEGEAAYARGDYETVPVTELRGFLSKLGRDNG